MPKRLVLACLTICLIFASRNATATTRVDLYTIGPGSYVFSKFGHSALCVTNEALPKGRCYDFGVTDATDPGDMIWGTLRGQKEFVAVGVEPDVLVKTFTEQDRDVFVQTLPLDEEHASKLADVLAADVENHTRYAYDPAKDNCTTELRDRLDVALDKKLSAPGPGTSSTQKTWRELCEEPFSGRILELSVLALAVGSPADDHPTAWEAMFLPFDLRDAVEARIGVKPEQLHERHHGLELRTSTNVGRGTLVLLGVFLSGFVWSSSRKGAAKLARSIRIVGITLGVVALALDLFALVTVIPWVRANWALLVLWPTDAAFGFLKPDVRATYTKVRLGALALFVVLSLTHLIGQPLTAIGLFVALPLATVAWRTGMFQRAA